MKEKILETIKKYNLIEENDKVVIGVSGGPDSISLLNVLNELKDELHFCIVVAHINHMIRDEADEETKYVKEFCNNIGIDCFVKKVNVIEKANNEKIGTEEAGRKARYDFLDEVLKNVKANKIAIAHNANDNAETVLMNIFRGAGTSGLKGIEPIRDGKYIRPLIECSRKEIEEYCEKNNLQPKIDKSNFENIYTRNKIRNVLIPELEKEFNPNIVEALNKLAILARQETKFIDEYVQHLLDNDLIVNRKLEQDNSNELVLDLKKFNQLDSFIKSKVVLAAIQKVFGSTQRIEKIHVEDIIRLCSKNIGNKYLAPNKEIKVMIKNGLIYFIKIA